MSSILTGLLCAALSTNAPVAVSNLIAQKTGISVPVANTNDPVERDYYKILGDDNDAEQDVIKWSDTADSGPRIGGGISEVNLNSRVRERLDGIKKEYEAFIAQHPDHVKIRLAYGSFLNDTHDEEGAVAQWDKARLLDPKNPAGWNNLANYYGHRGPVAKAFEYYDQAIALNANEPVYYHNLATTVYLFRTDAETYYHLTEQQVFDKSLELYRKAIRLAPDDFILFTDYAESFYGTKPPRWKDGLTAWTQALQVAHDDLEREGVCIHLARINLKLGQYAEARRDLDAVTNETFTILKKRLVRNLNLALHDATNAPAPTLAPPTNSSPASIANPKSSP